jgi:hypothetical protein
MNRTMLPKLALLLIALLFSVGSAELCARLFFHLDLNAPLKHRIPHPVLGWVLEPNADYINELPEGRVSVRYNSRGWHDVEHSQEQEEGTLRVLVFGDSFMEAYSVELEDAFHRQLGRIAGDDHVALEVFNFGVGGFGTLQEYLAFRELGQSFRPDLVLLGFYLGNDIRNNSLPLESILHASASKVTSRPFMTSPDESSWAISPIDYEGALQNYSEARAERSRLSWKLAHHSALIQASLPLLGRLRDAVWLTNSRAERVATERRRTRATDFAEFGIHYCDEDPEYTLAWLITQKILRRFQSDVANSGAELIVFSVPSLHEVEGQRIAKVSNRDLICLEEAPGHERLRGLLADLEIEYIDLLPSFRERHSGKRSLFRRSDRHWNKNGHQLAASMVYQALKEKGF